VTLGICGPLSSLGKWPRALGASLGVSMRAVLPSLIIFGLFIAAFVHYGNQIPQLKQLGLSQPKEATDTKDADPTPAELPPSDKPVTFVSPLEQLMGPADSTPEKPPVPHPLGKANPKDLIAPSPVGTSGVILHRTFSVANAVNFPFIIPAHAATPTLHGHYQSFTRPEGIQAADENTNIGFLLMNEAQYSDFINRRPVDALFSVDSSHDQDINFGLPSSLGQPAKFYLVFRNSPGEGRKTVKADFAVDF
jgi:hypothetical protein